MKKVLAAAIICAVSSFAAWDKFPVLGFGKGEAKAAVESGRQANNGGTGAWLGIRYSPLENLEIMSAKDFGGGNHLFGARYQVMPALAAGLDVGVPIPGTTWSIKPNVQYSMEMGTLVFGSNLGLTLHTEDPNKYTRGMDFEAGVEVKYAIEKSTLWASLDIRTGLGDSDDDGDKIKAEDEGRGMGMYPAVGYVANVSDNLALETFVRWGFGKKAYNDPMRTTIGVDFSVKF